MVRSAILASILTVLIVTAASGQVAPAQNGSRTDPAKAGQAPAYGYRPTLPGGGVFVSTSVGMARSTIRPLLQKRYHVTRRLRPTLTRNRRTLRLLDVTSVSLTPSTLAIDYTYSDGDAAQAAHQEFDLARQPYFLRVDDRDQAGAFSAALPTGAKAGSSTPIENLFAWSTRADAERFCDAINRLIDAARTREVAPAPISQDFVAAAKAWREVPDSRVSPPEQWQRERMMAETAVGGNDPFLALAHYEAGVFLYPTWPEGWFNAALLYETIGDYPYAVNRMQHYLELLPNAPDAGAARDKVRLWEEKARP